MTPATPAAFTLSVEVDGVAASPDASGRYVVRPGQSVAVRSNHDATWSGNDLGSGVTRTERDTGNAQWISRFANPSPGAPGSYRLTAGASGGRTLTLDFTVQTGDYRNGEYMLYAANGTRQKLTINFDTATYSTTDGTGGVESGTLTAPAGPATDWTVHSARIAGFNAASLRSLGDTIVGALPFRVPSAAPGTFAVYPFIATRAFLLSANRLDGVFNRLQIQYLTGGGRQSAISQLGVFDGGTVMKQCSHLTIHEIDTCPAASVVTSRLEPDPDNSGLWLMKHPTTNALMGRIGIAEINGEKIYLSGGASPSDGSQLLSIGLPSQTRVPTFTSSGWSTDGTLDSVVATPTTYDIDHDTGAISTHNLTLNTISPPGLHLLSDGTQHYFMIRSQTLELAVAARNSTLRPGFLHIGVLH
ncbi:MAG: hypothetical protein GTN84_01690 [Hydrogenophaga sp.]|uniref:hypothetical protein n=1 Tax=Hydrogenophaga sp. TaxID=1904254 RepID=UPI00168E0C05|nr:hypothetical protein [Hydrogenophaga sp.]NIM39864.1 hypothetical protein [Hydrogenophaga sp.]NIN25060.1 hypothetical protein [Hydrogenophaga sp.]NIN29627.1 hypothetical protein [Hydrogenophaga sp.]NIN54099.1 hypothetical protein [Hydrogenophaga sp.]NIO50512.1 hypothetical protein [Hydrogenophaga sp.]